MLKGVGVGSAVLLLLGLSCARALDGPAEELQAGAFSADRLFEKGRFETALTGGAFFSPFPPCPNRPSIDYTFTSVQLGYMLGDAKGSGLLRGNFELAGEGFGSAVTKGDGSYIAGGTLWLRYNFVHSTSARLVPFAEAGAGMVSTDLNREIVGQPFNFNLDLGLGTRYFIARNWALNLEYRYQHISNADTAKNNMGINACGPFLGISCFF
jgi:opacity protein-like surface antigen